MPLLLTFDVIELDTAGQPTGPGAPLEIDETGTISFGSSTDRDIVLEGDLISRHHFDLNVSDNRVMLTDQNSTNGTQVNNMRVGLAELGQGDVIDIPGWRLVVTSLQFAAAQVDDTPAPAQGFPHDVFGDDTLVDPAGLYGHGYPVEERKFCAVGGGLGSFTFVDHLRCYGVPASDIAVIGTEKVSYATYKRYCRDSQIPDHERLRSNSLSTPDNIWGFPGYASREAFGGLLRGRLGGFKRVFQVFGEPTLAESYTPRAGDVFDSLDREERRIDWPTMHRQGQARCIRKLTDGRYAVAYTMRDPAVAEADRRRIIIADVLHLATGYPATRFVDDFQTFIVDYPDHRHMVHNAYAPHDQIYDAAEAANRPVYVVVRGRGIVASRIIQRLHEARKRNPQITILHSMRSKLDPTSGARFGRARRQVRTNIEIQPFNWPKSCWGGDLRFEYERADAAKRGAMLTTLGGTTTAERSDWIGIIERGTEEGWYKPVYGSIREILPHDGSPDKVMIRVEGEGGHRAELIADYLVDCTGLISDITRSSLLNDLIETYGLKRNHAYARKGDGFEKRGPTGLDVTPDFEIEGLRNQRGRVYASGTVTSGGPYLAVDSFLGLQYSALRSTDHLVTEGAHGVKNLGPLRSAGQWLKWCRGAKP